MLQKQYHLAILVALLSWHWFFWFGWDEWKLSVVFIVTFWWLRMYWTFFKTLWPFIFFLWQLSIQFISLLFLSTFFFGIEILSSLQIIDNSLSDYIIGQDFSPILHTIFMTVFLLCSGSFLISCSPISIFFFLVYFLCHCSSFVSCTSYIQVPLISLTLMSAFCLAISSKKTTN